MSKNDKLFIELCLKHKDKLMDIFKSNMLNTRMGRVFIDFSSPNVLQEIKESERTLYKRQKT